MNQVVDFGLFLMHMH